MSDYRGVSGYEGSSVTVVIMSSNEHMITVSDFNY